MLDKMETVGGEGAKGRGGCRWRVLEEGQTADREGATGRGDCRWVVC